VPRLNLFSLKGWKVELARLFGYSSLVWRLCHSSKQIGGCLYLLLVTHLRSVARHMGSQCDKAAARHRRTLAALASGHEGWKAELSCMGAFCLPAYTVTYRCSNRAKVTSRATSSIKINAGNELSTTGLYELSFLQNTDCIFFFIFFSHQSRSMTPKPRADSNLRQKASSATSSRRPSHRLLSLYFFLFPAVFFFLC